MKIKSKVIPYILLLLSLSACGRMSFDLGGESVSSEQDLLSVYSNAGKVCVRQISLDAYQFHILPEACFKEGETNSIILEQAGAIKIVHESKKILLQSKFVLRSESEEVEKFLDCDESGIILSANYLAAGHYSVWLGGEEISPVEIPLKDLQDDPDAMYCMWE